MPTAKHRIAAYLPSDVDEKFQAFKQERGIGDSQALILILTEFLGVSHQMSYSDSPDIEALRSELLGEIEVMFGELRSELFDKPLESVAIVEESLKEVRISHDSLADVKVSHEELKVAELESIFIEHPTIAQLSARFGCDSALLRKQKSKYRNELEKFVIWCKSRDPDGYGWKFDEADRVFNRVIDQT